MTFMPGTFLSHFCTENSHLKIQICLAVLYPCFRPALAETLKVFLAHMKGSHGRVLRVLESVSVLCPSIVIDVIPDMTRAIKTSESLRGVGVDKELRFDPFDVYRTKLIEVGAYSL